MSLFCFVFFSAYWAISQVPFPILFVIANIFLVKSRQLKHLSFPHSKMKYRQFSNISMFFIISTSPLGKTFHGEWCTKITFLGNSLVVQWLGLLASTAGSTGSIPGQGTKIPHAARRSQKENHFSLGKKYAGFFVFCFFPLIFPLVYLLLKHIY